MAGGSTKRFKAAVIGGSGYGGAELIRRLLLHPQVELVRVASVDFIGEPLAAVHPNLEGRTDLKFEGISPGEAAKGMDIVLLGLPHKVSAQKMTELIATGARVVDLSGDFRLRDAAVYKRYYGADHTQCPERLTDGTFSLRPPRAKSRSDQEGALRRVSGLLRHDDRTGPLAARQGGPPPRRRRDRRNHASSSGSGIAPSAWTHHPVRAVNLRTYKPLDHQHIPEIVQTLGDAGAKNVAIRFVPVSAPLSRGIFATSFAHVDEKVTAEQIKALYAETYAREPFTRVPAKRLPEVVAVHGTNFCEVGVQVGEVTDGKRVVACFTATDNLVKGGAGQAIQSMNLMLGCDERASLEDVGGYP